MDPVRIAIVGCGVIGRMHTRLAKALPEVRIVALADARREQADALGQEFGVPKVYGSAEEVFADSEVEGVVLALPTNIRTPLALKAFAAGKHVLIEKPVAMNAAEARQLVKACPRKLVGACCSCRHTALESAQKAAEIVASGALGPVRLLRIRAVMGAGPRPDKPPPVWRVRKDLNGGGYLMNWGVYDLDFMFGILGWKIRPRLVLAQTWPVADHLASRVAEGSNAECHTAAFIRCDDGIVVTWERGEFTSLPTDTAWQITGARGSLRLNLLPGDNRALHHDDTSDEQGVVSRTVWSGTQTWDMVHSTPIRDFAQAIRRKVPPMTSLKRALLVQQVIDACYASAESGRAVRVR